MPGSRLSLDERYEIERACRWGLPLREAGRRIGRPASTVAREVNRNGGRHGYGAWKANRLAGERARRPKPCKLVARPALAAVVGAGLRRCWSPQQIAGRLRVDHPDDPHWWVSHETIYRSLYLQGRGGLQRELLEALRSGRTRRRSREERVTRGRIVGMIMIAERPPEAEDRAVPGHWEGDLIIGTREGSSQIGTLVERTSRFLMLVHLPEDRRAETVRTAIARKIAHLPEALVRTLTWDQGKEMSEHARFTVDTGVAVYFCDPYRPWQRGTVENTNGLLRQYFPRGADYSNLAETDLDLVADELNQRPRKTLGYRTPAEVFNQLLVATAP
jgi:IS30 family transposase